jgi:ParB/RepB/Spo0J family partition protein
VDSKLRSAIGLYFHLNTPAEERDAARQGIERLAKSQGMTFDAAIAAYCGPASVSAMAESIVSWADVHNDPTIKEMLRKQRAEDDRRACIWADKDRELQGWKAAAHDAAQTVDRLKEEAEDLVEDLGEANAEADRWQKEAQSNEKGGVEIDPANVKITERMRPLNEERVADLVNGFQEAGQLQPILVRAGCVTLIAGRHRLEAAIRLGRKVRAIWVDCDDITARKMEISENLHRAELTVLERAEHINEWRRLTVAHVSQLATPSGGAQPAEAGIRKTAQALGATKDEVSRAAKLDGLTDEAKAAAVAAGLDDNQSALLKVASYADADQVEAVSSPRRPGPRPSRLRSIRLSPSTPRRSTSRPTPRTMFENGLQTSKGFRNSKSESHSGRCHRFESIATTRCNSCSRI